MKRIQPAINGLHGNLIVPGDKSISHRAVMIGAISQGTTEINHFLTGEDCQTTIQAFRDLGVQIEENNDSVLVKGVGFSGLKKPKKSLNMGNSGTTTRLMMGLLAGSNFSTQMVGDNSLEKRPMKRVADPLKEFGGEVQLTTAGTLPATIIGHKLHHARYQMQVASAQVKSALIFAALQAESPSTIIEKLPTRNHTEIMLNQFGADIQTINQKEIIVNPCSNLIGQQINVPGDISSAAFFLVAGVIVPNSRLTLKRVNLNPTRTGIIKVLQKMGANIQIENIPAKGEPLGNITVSTSQLKAIDIGAEDIPALIDELPLVALLAACSEGKTTITGAEELRVKETDRIKATATELRKFGVGIQELPDGMIIQGCDNWKVADTELDSHGDHRIGMMDVIASLKVSQTMNLHRDEAINISYPGFFEDLAELRGN